MATDENGPVEGTRSARHGHLLWKPMDWESVGEEITFNEGSDSEA